jgi:hypothetical protein
MRKTGQLFVPRHWDEQCLTHISKDWQTHTVQLDLGSCVYCNSVIQLGRKYNKLQMTYINLHWPTLQLTYIDLQMHMSPITSIQLELS